MYKLLDKIKVWDLCLDGKRCSLLVERFPKKRQEKVLDNIGILW